MTSKHNISTIGERGIIEEIASELRRKSPDVLLGIGDDCAVTKWKSAGTVLTTDMLVEGTHFLRTKKTDWFALGRKSVAVNISDTAAMGAESKFIMVSLGAPGDLTSHAVKELYRGMREEAARWGAVIVGGDTVGAPQVIINIALIAAPMSNRPLPRRSNCRPGMHLYVSGILGASAAGLRLITDPKCIPFARRRSAAALLARHNTPEPRVPLGRALVSSLDRLAMIDISDSLWNETNLLAAASKVGILVNIDAVPLAPGLQDFAAASGDDPRVIAAFSGEEYELLFATDLGPSGMAQLLAKKRIATPVTRIGEIFRGKGVVFVDNLGNQLALENQTFSHF